jgi:ACS family sodium-dependent inorganic phosphate cotransporter
MADRALANAAEPARGSWPRRYTVVVLFSLATVLCYLDRTNISVAIIPLAREKGYDAATQGLILSSFFWGYLWLQLPAGWLADRFGGKKVLAAGVLLWSLGTLLTPLASASLGMLLAARVMVGLGEAANFPTIQSLAARWTPASERARALSLSYSGMFLGTVLALLLSPPIILAFGWRALFYLCAALGAIWIAAWGVKAADMPEELSAIDRDELAFILADRPHTPRVDTIPWAALFRESAVWAIILAQFCHNWGFFVIVMWFPTYLHQVFGVPLARVGALSLIPWAVTFAMSNAGGLIADTLRARGLSTTVVRKLLQSVAFALGALPLLALPWALSPGVAVALVTAAEAGVAIGLAAFGVNHIDVAPKYAGVLMGVANTFGALPGIIGVGGAGFIYKYTGSFTAVFYQVAAVYVIGLVGYFIWASGEQKVPPLEPAPAQAL